MGIATRWVAAEGHLMGRTLDQESPFFMGSASSSLALPEGLSPGAPCWVRLLGFALSAEDAPADPESDLVRRAAAADQGAFEELYRRHVKKIYNLVFRMVGTLQEAEDVTQEVFYQAYKNLPRFEGRSKFYTWIFRIATNVCLQYLKRHVRQKRETLVEDVPDPAPDSSTLRGTMPSPDSEVETKAFYEALEKAVLRLPPNQRAVMVLGPLQGHSYEEIAQILGTTEEVIKGRLHRARENIREFLKEER